MHRRGTVAAIAASFLALPAAAHGASQTVFAGTPPSAQSAFQKQGVDVNQFFPSTLTVHVGDTVKFTPVGFHNVDMPPKGGRGVPFLSPTGKKIAGENDAAGTPFWFNGQDQLGFTPLLTKVNYGKTFSAPSPLRISSGLPLVAKPKPMSVRFRKPGSYSYLCDLHTGMKGTVKVVAAGKPAPNAAGVAKLVAAQVKTAKASAASLPGTSVPANTVLLGADKAGVYLFSYLPGTLKVAPGTTVDFRMQTPSSEAHTVTFGPGDPGAEGAKSYLGDLAASFEAPAIAGAAIYPSEAPGSPVSAFGPGLHGNGFWNSGVLDGAPASPLPAASRLKFDTPGSYTYYCLIHPFMKGEVVVG